MNEISLWLYGSRARGDADDRSDTDLLAVGDSDEGLEDAVAAFAFERPNVSFYTWAELCRLRSYGSLFLVHIALEGVCLRASEAASARMARIVDELPRFARAREDLAGFRRAYSDGVSSLQNGGWPDFECAVIGAIARHGAILGSYCLGSASFGRERPFFVVGPAVGYDDVHIRALAKPCAAWRLNCSGPHTSPVAMGNWLQLVDRFLKDLGRVVDDYEDVLSRVA
jgi:hypothetical protein